MRNAIHLLWCLGLLAGCAWAEPEVEPITLEPARLAQAAQNPSANPIPIVPTPSPAPIAAPTTPVAPSPDPEAIARAQAEAAEREFERAHPFHGVAYHFLGQIFRRPNNSSAVVGYMRRGAQFRAESSVRGPGCARGWHRVVGGGYVCRGAGFQLGSSPQTFSPSPMQPAVDGALPYAYARVRADDVPQYWHLPTVEEERLATEWIARQRHAEETADDDDETAPEPDLEAPPGFDENDAVIEITAVALDNASADRPAGADAGPPDVDERPSFLRMRMQRGFYVSIDRLETSGGRRFFRTIRSAYVPARSVAETAPPTMRGVVLGGRWRLPVGFVFRSGVRTLRRDPETGALSMDDGAERHAPFPLSDENIRRRRTHYRISDRGDVIRRDALRIASQVEIPAGVPDGASWMHVDLSTQTLVAYDGDRPVFATMISSGRSGFETPTGTFRVQSKHISTTMDDPNAGDESYSIEDVPWTMYFEGSYALHAAFWHDRFGRPRSHGCVNLAPADARWLFEWSAPPLPPGWHGQIASPRQERTWIHVTSDDS